MRIKAGSIWRDPKQVAFKTDAVWKEASEVHHKQGNGEWLKVYDGSPVLKINLTCNVDSSGETFPPCYYEIIANVDYIIQSGDCLEYEMLYTGFQCRPGVEIILDDIEPQTMFYKLYNNLQIYLPDQNGNPAAVTRSVWTENFWHYRKIDLTAIATKRILRMLVVAETIDPGVGDIMFRNITIRRSDGSKALDVFTSTLHVPSVSPSIRPYGDVRNTVLNTKGVVGPYNP
jgi:hypothetical protein